MTTERKKPGPTPRPEKFKRPFRGRAPVEDIEELGGPKAVYRMVSDWVMKQAAISRRKKKRPNVKNTDLTK